MLMLLGLKSNHMQRRNDLIPTLFNSVKGAMTPRNKMCLENIADARSKLSGAWFC